MRGQPGIHPGLLAGGYGGNSLTQTLGYVPTGYPTPGGTGSAFTPPGQPPPGHWPPSNPNPNPFGGPFGGGGGGPPGYPTPGVPDGGGYGPPSGVDLATAEVDHHPEEPVVVVVAAVVVAVDHQVAFQPPHSPWSHIDQHSSSRQMHPCSQNSPKTRIGYCGRTRHMP